MCWKRYFNEKSRTRQTSLALVCYVPFCIHCPHTCLCTLLVHGSIPSISSIYSHHHVMSTTGLHYLPQWHLVSHYKLWCTYVCFFCFFFTNKHSSSLIFLVSWLTSEEICLVYFMKLFVVVPSIFERHCLCTFTLKYPPINMATVNKKQGHVLTEVVGLNSTWRSHLWLGQV